MRRARRKLGFVLILGAVAVPLALVSAAYACGVLATLYLSPGQVQPGAKVSGYGRNYSPSPKASLVTLRFNSRTGPVLWSGHPTPSREILPSFQVPHARAGYYLIMAEQTGPTGKPSPGTPGRAVLFIGKRGSRAAARQSSAWLPTTTAGGSGPRASASGSPALPLGSQNVLLASLLSGTLLASGLLVLRGDRRRRGPSLAS